MSATDEGGGGGDEGWVARLSRLLGVREEDTHAALAARSSTTVIHRRHSAAP